MCFKVIRIEQLLIGKTPINCSFLSFFNAIKSEKFRFLRRDFTLFLYCYCYIYILINRAAAELLEQTLILTLIPAIIGKIPKCSTGVEHEGAENAAASSRLRELCSICFFHRTYSYLSFGASKTPAAQQGCWARRKNLKISLPLIRFLTLLVALRRSGERRYPKHSAFRALVLTVQRRLVCNPGGF